MTNILKCGALAAVSAAAVLAVPAAAQDPEADSTPPSYRLELQSLRVDTDGDRRVRFALTCHETEERCIGTLKLKTNSSKPVKLGRRMFDVPPGANRAVPLRLSKQAAAWLERRLGRGRRVKLRGVAQSYDTWGNRARRSLIFTPILSD